MHSTAWMSRLRRNTKSTSRPGKEVDFAVKAGLSIEQLLQVCYEVEHPQTRKREISSLIKAAKETRCRKLAILTWDYKSQEGSDPSIEFNSSRYGNGS